MQSCLCFALGSASLDVCVEVEVGEEYDKGCSIANECVVHPLREVAINVERMECMNDGQTELKLEKKREREGGKRNTTLMTNRVK